MADIDPNIVELVPSFNGSDNKNSIIVSLKRDKITFRKSGFSLLVAKVNLTDSTLNLTRLEYDSKRLDIKGNDDLVFNTTNARIYIYIKVSLLNNSGSSNWNNIQGLIYSSSTQVSEDILLATEFFGQWQPSGALATIIATLPDVISHNMDKVAAINSAAYRLGSDNKILQLLITSDAHRNVIPVKNAGIILENIDTIDAGIELGDSFGGDTCSNFSEHDDYMASTKPVLRVLGNHDVSDSKDVTTCNHNNEVYNLLIQPYETNIGGVHNGENYYYKDFTNHKIRIICLYEFDDPNDLDPGSNNTLYRIRRGERVLSQAQINWFITTLLNTPTDYHVVVALHQTIESSANLTFVKNPFTSSEANVIVYRNLISGNPITDIIDAFINETSMNIDYSFTGDANYLSDINATADFTTRGAAGNFICYLGGHIHQDAVCHPTAHLNQKQIIVAATASDNFRSQYNDIKRVEGTKSEDALTVISFDTVNRKIKLVRLGADITYDMTERKYATINY